MSDFGDFYIIYPEKRFVKASVIHGWYTDAVANGDIDQKYLNAKTHNEMAEALEDAGIITLGKPPSSAKSFRDEIKEMDLIDLPNMHSIEGVWAFISVDKDGNEGICAASLLGANSYIPLITGDEKRIKDLTIVAKRIASMTDKTIKLVKFKNREEVEIINPSDH